MNKFSENFTQLRKENGLSQQNIADKFGITVQAVSKWECAQSYPDIELLSQIAELFDTTADFLLTGKQKNESVEYAEIPDDNVLRVVQFRGNKMITQDKCEPNQKIRLMIAKDLPHDIEYNIEIWGSVQIDGNVKGNVKADNGSVSCGSVGQCVECGGSVNCGGVGQVVTAHGNVNCGAVGQVVTAKGGVGQYVEAGGDVTCSNVGATVTAGGNAKCGNIGASLNAGNDVECKDIGGKVDCGGSLKCNIIKKGVSSCGGDIHCENICGDVHCEGKTYDK